MGFNKNRILSGMINFLTYKLLNEAAKSAAEAATNTQLKHLEHPEDNIFIPEIFGHSLAALWNVHNQLAGNTKGGSLLVSTKIDGAPSLVFGVHPLTKKFFVGTKSVFNKKPKINYSDGDIDVNHGHAPGLAMKLKEALKYLPDIMPPKGGVYQGDVLFGERDKTEDRYGIHFQPNTINYTVDKNHPDYKNIKAAKFGIAVHTMYNGVPRNEDTLEGMRSGFDSKAIKLKSHRNVHQSDLTFKQSTITSYENERLIESGLKRAEDMWNKFDRDMRNALTYHGPMFKTFINANIRNSETATVNAYEEWAISRFQKNIDSMKSERGKEKHQQLLDEFLVRMDIDRGTLRMALTIHNIVEQTKNLIVDAMNTSNHQYQHTVNGRATAPEGYVATSNGIPIKLVHRHEFSKLNFNNTNF